MHPPFLFWSCQKRNGPCTVQREKTLWRAPVQWPSARDGGRRIGACSDFAWPSGTLWSFARSIRRPVADGVEVVGVVVALNCFSFRYRRPSLPPRRTNSGFAGKTLEKINSCNGSVTDAPVLLLPKFPETLPLSAGCPVEISRYSTQTEQSPPAVRPTAEVSCSGHPPPSPSRPPESLSTAAAPPDSIPSSFQAMSAEVWHMCRCRTVSGSPQSSETGPTDMAKTGR